MADRIPFYMSPRRTRRYLGLGVFACVVAVAGGCSFQSFEYLKKGGKTSAKGGQGGEDTGQGGTTDLGGTTGDGGVGDAGGIPGTAGGNSKAGATSVGGGGTSGTAGGAGGATAGAAGSGAVAGGTGTAAGGAVVVPSLGPFEFNTEADVVPSLWKMSPETTAGSTITWQAQGEAAPLGSMVLTVPTGTGSIGNFFCDIPATFADQSAKTKVNYRVRTVAGSARVKPYATSTGWIWVDGGEFTVSAAAWSTASMNLVTPSYESVGSDGTLWTRASMTIVGLQLSAEGTVLVDRIWLE